MADQRRYINRLCRLRWSCLDSVFLMSTLIGACILAITVTTVWYPCLQISKFLKGQCLVLHFDYPGPEQCIANPGQCLTVTIPTNFSAVNNRKDARMSPSFPQSTMSSMTNTSMTATTTTTQTPWIPPDENSENNCREFPCIQIKVQYIIPTKYGIFRGIGQLYPDYQQLQNYPRCSYSACSTTDYIENGAHIFEIVGEQWRPLQLSKQPFDCYVYNGQVLVDGWCSAAIAFNSIFWPAVFSGVCLLLLTGHLCLVNVLSRRKRDSRLTTSKTASASMHRNRQQELTAVTISGRVHMATVGRRHDDLHPGVDEPGYCWKDDIYASTAQQAVDKAAVRYTELQVQPTWFDMVAPPSYTAKAVETSLTGAVEPTG